MGNPPLKAIYQRGSTRSRKYTTEHPKLLNVGYRQLIVWPVWPHRICNSLLVYIISIKLFSGKKLNSILQSMQRIQYARTKSDVIAKADGTFVPREKRKRHDDKGITL